MEIILNLDLLAWNILMFVHWWTNSEKTVPSRNEEDQKGHCNLIFKKLLPPQTSMAVKSISVMLMLKRADIWLLMHGATPKHLVTEGHLQHVLFWIIKGQGQSNNSKREWTSGLRLMQKCEWDSQLKPRMVPNPTFGSFENLDRYWQWQSFGVMFLWGTCRGLSLPSVFW